MHKKLSIRVAMLALCAFGSACQSNNQALLRACGKDDGVAHPEAIKSLIAAGAKVDVVDEDEDYGGHGRQPIHYAAEKGDVDAVKILLAAGAKVDAADADGNQPIHDAVGSPDDNFQLAKILLAAGAKVDAVNKWGMQPIHCAAMYGHTETVKFLVGNGAKVDAVDASGIQPLHYAALNGYAETAKFLLANEAKASAKDVEGKTASIWAYSVWMKERPFRYGGLSPVILRGGKVDAEQTQKMKERFAEDEKRHKELAAFLKEQETKEATDAK